MEGLKGTGVLSDIDTMWLQGIASLGAMTFQQFKLTGTTVSHCVKVLLWFSSVMAETFYVSSGCIQYVSVVSSLLITNSMHCGGEDPMRQFGCICWLCNLVCSDVARHE